MHILKIQIQGFIHPKIHLVTLIRSLCNKEYDHQRNKVHADVFFESYAREQNFSG